MYLVSDILRDFWTVRLKCRGCEKVTNIGLDGLLSMSKRNDDLAWWRERLKCSSCGEGNPYFSTVSTHMTPPPKGN